MSSTVKGKVMGAVETTLSSADSGRLRSFNDFFGFGVTNAYSCHPGAERYRENWSYYLVNYIAITGLMSIFFAYFYSTLFGILGLILCTGWWAVARFQTSSCVVGPLDVSHESRIWIMLSFTIIYTIYCVDLVCATLVASGLMILLHAGIRVPLSYVDLDKDMPPSEFTSLHGVGDEVAGYQERG